MIEIWGLPTCDSCRKARAALPEARFRDIRAEPLTEADIADLIAAFGDRAVNRASATWLALSEGERARPPAALLADHPALMKRPVIRQGDRLSQGLPKP
jgi:arsenate reductase-like glutaredoxin family protein